MIEADAEAARGDISREMTAACYCRREHDDDAALAPASNYVSSSHAADDTL